MFGLVFCALSPYAKRVLLENVSALVCIQIAILALLSCTFAPASVCLCRVSDSLQFVFFLSSAIFFSKLFFISFSNISLSLNLLLETRQPESTLYGAIDSALAIDT